MINNKGNTLVEAVLCLALLSMSVIGFYVIIFNIKSINAKKEYEAILYTNILTIFNTCEIDPSNAIDTLFEVYNSQITMEDSQYIIDIDLVNEYKGLKNIGYVVLIEDNVDHIIVNIEVLNPYEYYGDISNEKICTRIIKK